MLRVDNLRSNERAQIFHGILHGDELPQPELSPESEFPVS